MKKAFIAATLALVLCLGTVALVACNPSESTTAVAQGEDLYTMGYTVATAASILGAGGGSATTAAETDDQTAPEGLEEQLGIFEQFIDRANVKVEAGESDEDGYEFKLTVTTETAGGEKHVYAIHYNIVADKTVDKNGKEIDFAIEGVLVVDDESYDISGSFATDSSLSEEDGHLFSFTLTDLAGNSISFDEQKVLKDGKYQEKYNFSFEPAFTHVPEYSIAISFENSGIGGETLVVESDFADFIVTTIRYTRCYDVETGEYYLNVNVQQPPVNVDVEVRYERDENNRLVRSYSVSGGFDWESFEDLFDGFHSRFDEYWYEG